VAITLLLCGGRLGITPSGYNLEPPNPLGGPAGAVRWKSGDYQCTAPIWARKRFKGRHPSHRVADDIANLTAARFWNVRSKQKLRGICHALSSDSTGDIFLATYG